MSYNEAPAEEPIQYRKVSYFIGTQEVFAQRIPVKKSKFKVIRLILTEAHSSRPYSHIQLKNHKGRVFNVAAPVSFLKLLCLYKQL